MCKGQISTCKSKKVDRASSLVESIIRIKFPNKTTKVRSGINRPLKSTAWGSLQKLAGGFGQNCEPSTSNSHLIENGGSLKRSGKKEQPSIRKTRSSRRSKSMFSPLSAIGFASDEMNSQPFFSVTTRTYASSEGYIGNFPILDHHALVNGSDDAHKTAECKSIQTGLQQLDRCLESVTQESCPAYICGNFAKSTSEPSLNIAGVGFSPDSVLDVASATCENNTSANHDVKLGANPSYPAALAGNGLHASALSTFDSGKNHALLPTDLGQWAHTAREDESTRNEDIKPSHAILGYIGEGKVQVLPKSNAVRKSKEVVKQERQKKDGMKGNNIKDRGSTKTPLTLRAFSYDSYSLVPSVPPKFGSCFGVVTSATQGISMHEHDSMQGLSVIGKERTSALDNVKSLRRKKKDDSGGKTDAMRDPYVKGKNMNKNIAGNFFFDSESSTSPSQLVTDLTASHTNEQSRSPLI
jgi:histone-lysine N-methyltransferase SETD2